MLPCWFQKWFGGGQAILVSTALPISLPGCWTVEGPWKREKRTVESYNLQLPEGLEAEDAVSAISRLAICSHAEKHFTSFHFFTPLETRSISAPLAKLAPHSLANAAISRH